MTIRNVNPCSALSVDTSAEETGEVNDMKLQKTARKELPDL
jgi:hypothetical protein